MRLRFRNLTILLALLASLLSNSLASVQAATQQPATWQTKVAKSVLAQTALGETEFLVVMSAQADLSHAADLPNKQAKGRYVYETLTQLAARSQAGLLGSLQASGAQTRSYWIANLIWVRGDLTTVQAAASRNDVYRIIANPWVRGNLGEQALSTPSATVLSPDLTVEWNLTKVGAPLVWEAGYTGTGVVIGGQDTGYNWNHAALINSYRGWNGSQSNHNYNWHDAIREEITSDANPCGLNVQSPCDDHGHGTHTMGTMVGDDGAGYRVGMAPGARWIGCRNMESGYGKPSTYIECYQWFLAPTDLNNLNPEPDLAPHIINNSWGCPPYEGCTDPTVMETVVNNLTAAGILSVHSAGNSGSACSSVSDPAAIYTSSFTVGNTTSTDNLSSSSSRGPVLVDGSGRRKPDISAPGTAIRSAVPGNSYTSMSGTSMAGPHVAGLAALLISANPGLANQPALLRRMIEVSANPNVLVLAQTCGGISSTSIPNNQFGWGRIDAAAAVELVLQQLTGLAPQVQTLAVPPNAEAAINIQTTNRMPAGSGLDLGAVALRAIIPAETTFISATSPYIRNQDLITWTVGSLPAGSVYSVTLNLGAPDVLYAEIPILSDTLAGSAVPISASGSLTVSALQASLSSPLQSASNLPLTYTFTISNAHGSENLATLVANSPLPPGTILISASQPFTQVGNTISWNRDMLEPGAHWIVFFTIQPDPDAWISDPVIIGTATVQAAGVSKPTVKPFQTFMLAPWRNYIPLIKR